MTSEFQVRYSETDQMGVVHHSNYLVWCEVGRTDFIDAHGMSYAEMERTGVKLAVTEASVRLHAPARYGETVRVETRLVDVRSRQLVFDYVITRVGDGARLAGARTTLVSIGGDGRPVTLPPGVRAALEAVVSP